MALQVPAATYARSVIGEIGVGEMKAFGLAVGFALVLVVAGCGGSEQVAAKPVMPAVTGRQLDVALSDIKRAGIDDEAEIVGGGTFGVVNKSAWTVCEQLPAAGQAVTTKPRLTVDRSCDTPKSATTATATTEPATTTAPATTTVPATTAPTTTMLPATTKPPALPMVLTPGNNADLAALLQLGDQCDGAVQRFASKYRGKTIEFDGNIATMAKHGSYDTRYDFLVWAGDYSETSMSGPNFQFRDKNFYDLHVTGGDSVSQGDNIHVKAEVGEYIPEQCLFLLTPVSTRLR